MHQPGCPYYGVGFVSPAPGTGKPGERDLAAIKIRGKVDFEDTFTIGTIVNLVMNHLAIKRASNNLVIYPARDSVRIVLKRFGRVSDTVEDKFVELVEEQFDDEF